MLLDFLLLKLSKENVRAYRSSPSNDRRRDSFGLAFELNRTALASFNGPVGLSIGHDSPDGWRNENNELMGDVNGLSTPFHFASVVACRKTRNVSFVVPFAAKR